jgi:hypothetical protein
LLRGFDDTNSSWAKAAGAVAKVKPRHSSTASSRDFLPLSEFRHEDLCKQYVAMAASHSTTEFGRRS